MDKYELKDKLCYVYDEMSKLTGLIAGPGCKDQETAEIRSRVLSLLTKLGKEIHEEIYNIY